jgi:hypothetical protein
MNSLRVLPTINRYQIVTEEKSNGATYTPKPLADFVARHMVDACGPLVNKKAIRVLDPAVGDGELLISLLQHLESLENVEVFGFDTDKTAIIQTHRRFDQLFPGVSLKLQQESFLEYVLAHFDVAGTLPMFASQIPGKFDFIIANPPYVRTQIVGSHQARIMARQFGLTGRVDLYHAFLVAMAAVLEPHGIAGIIVSNRFMTTKSGAAVRAAIRERLNLYHIWDLGDTKLFNAAVLPSILVAHGKNSHEFNIPAFTSIYETDEPGQIEAGDALAALSHSGIVSLPSGRQYTVKHGRLDTSGGLDAVWRIATEATDVWLARVDAHTWGTFKDIGKIRVGVKTCADKIYISSDWETVTEDKPPELLRPLTTHHIARRFRALEPSTQPRILYTHESVEGRRQAVNIDLYPRTRAYLEQHRAVLEGRKYVIEAGRKWFEIWVPQDPLVWEHPKLVFRDISEKPVFWIDQQHTIVNGDCYWMIADSNGEEELLWLAVAVANSTFIELFYDRRFNNKLYARRRRFITQYVEQFPLPSPDTKLSREIIDTAKVIYNLIGTPEANALETHLNFLVWRAFGFSVEEIGR